MRVREVLILVNAPLVKAFDQTFVERLQLIRLLDVRVTQNACYSTECLHSIPMVLRFDHCLEVLREVTLLLVARGALLRVIIVDLAQLHDLLPLVE